MVRRQTRVQKRNRRQQNKSRRNNRRQNKSLRRKRQSRRKLRGGSRYNNGYRNPYAPDHFRETAKDREIRERREQEEREKYKADEETAKGYGMTAEEYRAMFAW